MGNGAYDGPQNDLPELIIQRQQAQHVSLCVDSRGAEIEAAKKLKRLDQLLATEEGRKLIGVVGQRAVQLQLQATALSKQVETLQIIQEEVEEQIQQKLLKNETLEVSNCLGPQGCFWGERHKLGSACFVKTHL
jgi:hypothetical protein